MARNPTPTRKPTKPAPPPLKPAAKRGRPPEHVPDDATRGRVIAWAGGGIEHKFIALGLKIGLSTLRRHYKGELLIGQAEMDGLAVATLGKAMQRGGKEGVAAAKWWTQSRMGWTERVIVDDGRPADTPLRIIVELVGDSAPPRVGEAAAAAAAGASRWPDMHKHVQLVG